MIKHAVRLFKIAEIYWTILKGEELLTTKNVPNDCKNVFELLWQQDRDGVNPLYCIR